MRACGRDRPPRPRPVFRETLRPPRNQAAARTPALARYASARLCGWGYDALPDATGSLFSRVVRHIPKASSVRRSRDGTSGSDHVRRRPPPGTGRVLVRGSRLRRAATTAGLRNVGGGARCVWHRPLRSRSGLRHPPLSRELARWRARNGGLLETKQFIQGFIADSYIDIQAARLMTLHCAEKMENMGEARTDISGDPGVGRRRCAG